eukprot:1157973-Pelagomonas_calceolata.AAC.1
MQVGHGKAGQKHRRKVCVLLLHAFGTVKLARMRASTCASMHAGALFWGCVQLPFVQICMSMRLCMHSLVQEGKCTWVWMWVWVYVAAPECHAKRTCSALPSRRLGDGLVRGDQRPHFDRSSPVSENKPQKWVKSFDIRKQLAVEVLRFCKQATSQDTVEMLFASNEEKETQRSATSLLRQKGYKERKGLRSYTYI